MSKIVFFDIDGTLYMEGVGIPASAREALKRLRENGHKIVLCTGRSNAFVPKEYLSMGIDGFIGGAGAYAQYDQTVIAKRTVEPQEISTLIEWARANDIQVVLEGVNNGFYDDRVKDPQYYEMLKWLEKSMCVQLQPVEDAQDVLKWTFHNITEDQVTEIMGLLHNKFYVIHHLETNFRECLPVGTSKKSGIQDILEATNIPWENTYAFGDSLNDLDMIEYVKHGVAMGNAIDKLKEVADHVTDDIDKDGIYNGLEKLGLI